ncbi:MAG TPA: hypothetical protein VIJ23_10330 [Mycobacterium sp.]
MPGPVAQPTRVVTGEVTTAACEVVAALTLAVAAVSRRAHDTSPHSGAGSTGAVGGSLTGATDVARTALGANAFDVRTAVSELAGSRTLPAALARC